MVTRGEEGPFASSVRRLVGAGAVVAQDELLHEGSLLVLVGAQRVAQLERA